MALSDIDRRLLQRCLAGEDRSWEDFVDRFMGLVIHVVDHTAKARGVPLAPEDREDLIAEVFFSIVRDDLSVLRRFRGDSSLATYLTVIARRVVVRQVVQWQQSRTLERARQGSQASHGPAAHGPAQRDAAEAIQESAERRISDQEELERLLARLDGDEAQVVRMYHLEGMSYREISSRVGMPENSIGPTLSRARLKMRQASAS